MMTNQTTVEVFFTAFKALRSKEREAFIGRIINDHKLSEDLIDIVLIEKAKKAKGKPVSARAYFAKQHKAEGLS